MKKPENKLLISAFLTVFAIALMVTVSYAWMTLSDSPAVEGIQINIGGGNTIKVAPDKVVEVNGRQVHYPGYFQEYFELSQYQEYDYLKTHTGLTPVSTADGIHWFSMPNTASMSDNLSYQLSDYSMDVTFAEDSYLYVDFWVVSPLADCALRLSIGSESEGTFLIGMPGVEADSTETSGYTLNTEYNDAAACARIGFLVNPEDITDNTAMEQYIASKAYDKTYTKLKGTYQEAGEAIDTSLEYNFLIYEPNALLHNSDRLALIQKGKGLSYTSAENGDYVVTKPISYKEGIVQLTDISDCLVVQQNNTWKQTDGGDTLINQIFQGNMLNKSVSGATVEELAQNFFLSSMQGKYSEYVNRGSFFSSTKMLYYAGNGTVTNQDDMTYLKSTDAVSDGVIVSLERNVPQRIRMYIWLEGQDVDCVKEAALEYIAIGIELAGSTQD